MQVLASFIMRLKEDGEIWKKWENSWGVRGKKRGTLYCAPQRWHTWKSGFWDLATISATTSSTKYSFFSSVNLYISKIGFTFCLLTNTYGIIKNEKLWVVLRSRIRDPVPFWPLDPGSGMGKKTGSGSGMNNPNHISQSIETNFLG